MKKIISVLSLVLTISFPLRGAGEFFDYQNYNHGYCPKCQGAQCRCGQGGSCPSCNNPNVDFPLPTNPNAPRCPNCPQPAPPPNPYNPPSCASCTSSNPECPCQVKAPCPNCPACQAAQAPCPRCASCSAQAPCPNCPSNPGAPIPPPVDSYPPSPAPCGPCAGTDVCPTCGSAAPCCVPRAPLSGCQPGFPIWTFGIAVAAVCAAAAIIVTAGNGSAHAQQ